MKTVIRLKGEMRDSRIEWMKMIPNEWTTPKLLYVLRNKISDGPHETPNYVENGIPFISLECLNESKTINFSLCKRFISQEDYNRYSLKTKLEMGDILFSKAASIGKTAIVDERQFMVWSPIAIIKSNARKIDNKFLYYLLNCTELIMSITLNGSVNTQINVGMREIEQVRIPLPILPEQQIIAAYLDEKCEKIDEIIAEAKASIDEYKELKQSVIFEAVTKGLDKNVEMKDSGVKAIGKVNNKYNVAKIAELNDGLTDGTHGTYERFDSGKLLLSSKNVQHNGLVIGNNESYISEEDSNSIVANGFPQKNDLLLCCIGASIGRCILYPFDYPIAFQRSVIFIRCNKWILPKMMMYNLQSTSSLMQEQMVVNVSAQAGLYQGLVKQLYVMVPPIGEQEKIILFLDKKTAEIDSLIAEKESLINDLEAYKKSLIYEVVTGKRRVV